MRYTNDEKPGSDAVAVRETLEGLVTRQGMSLVELGVFRGKTGTVRVQAVVYKPGTGTVIGTDDCSRVHRAILPQLENAFPGADISVEVSSPGINRQIKTGAEFAFYLGRGVRCWRTDISDWSAGVLEAADGQGITIKGNEGKTRLDYTVIAKAALDPSQEEYFGH